MAVSLDHTLAVARARVSGSNAGIDWMCPKPWVTYHTEKVSRASAEIGRPIYILSDEPYSRLVFDGKPLHSPTAYYPNSLLAYSYGKTLLTPGERIGYTRAAGSLVLPGMDGRRGPRSTAPRAAPAPRSGGLLLNENVMDFAYDCRVLLLMQSACD